MKKSTYRMAIKGTSETAALERLAPLRSRTAYGHDYQFCKSLQQSKLYRTAEDFLTYFSLSLGKLP